MERRYKSGGIEEILVFPYGIRFGGSKSGGMKNSFVWLRRKNERIENNVCRNLLSCPY